MSSRRWEALHTGPEHYVVDLLLGWGLAAVVTIVVGRVERRRAAGARDRSVDGVRQDA